MYFAGIGDEAGADIEIQIRAAKALGWANIELRNTGFPGDIATMSDPDFEKLYAKIANSMIRINCFASGIANWGKDIMAPFEDSLKEVKASIPRMNRLGVKLVRIMSYATRRDPATWRILPDAEQLFDERAKRLKEIVRRFLDAGIMPAHENCMNYGGLSWKHTLRLVEAVPDLKLVFDTGNPLCSVDMSKNISDENPPIMQDSWEFYSHVKQHIAYVHIKDARGKAQFMPGSAFPSGLEFTFPGEGLAKIPEIVNDLLRNGYDGGFSIEPHMKIVFHEEKKQSGKEDASIENYLEYGRRFMEIVRRASPDRY